MYQEMSLPRLSAKAAARTVRWRRDGRSRSLQIISSRGLATSVSTNRSETLLSLDPILVLQGHCSDSTVSIAYHTSQNSSTGIFYDVVVVGGGHAGCEASAAAARCV